MGAGTGAGRGRGSRCHAHAPQRRGASVARRRRRSAGSLAARWRLVPIPWRGGGGALSRTRASLQRRREGPAGRGRALPLARRAPLARQSGLHILADVAAAPCPQRSDGLTGGRRRGALGTARVAAEDQVLVAAAGERVGCAEPGSDDTPRQDDVAAARGRGWTVRARVCSPGIGTMPVRSWRRQGGSATVGGAVQRRGGTGGGVGRGGVEGAGASVIGPAGCGVPVRSGGGIAVPRGPSPGGRFGCCASAAPGSRSKDRSRAARMALRLRARPPARQPRRGAAQPLAARGTPRHTRRRRSEKGSPRCA